MQVEHDASGLRAAGCDEDTLVNISRSLSTIHWFKWWYFVDLLLRHFDDGHITCHILCYPITCEFIRRCRWLLTACTIVIHESSDVLFETDFIIFL